MHYSSPGLAETEAATERVGDKRGAASTPWKRAAIAAMALLVLVFAFYLYSRDLERNPPAFYIDESSIAYNALQIALEGRGEFGEPWPVYFRAFGEYKNPAYIYLLALVYRLGGPSIWISRMLSVVLGVLTAVVLARLTRHLVRPMWISWFVGLLALTTPWLFELSRMVLEVALFPLAYALFLWSVHAAERRWGWSVRASLLVAGSLALVTYSYSIGRLLGPLLLAALFLFWKRERTISFLAGLIGYGILVLPIALFNLLNPGALTERFNRLTWLHDTPLAMFPIKLARHVASSLDPINLFVRGDSHLPIRTPDSGGLLFAATGLLAILGFLVVLTSRLHERWWMFMFVASMLSVVPAALTQNDFSAFRLIPVPILALVYCAIGLEQVSRQPKPWRQRFIAVLIAATLIQSAMFFRAFSRGGPLRAAVFDADYPAALEAAASTGIRPIHVIDRSPAYQDYIHAYWYGALLGIPREDFVRLRVQRRIPSGALVLDRDEPPPGSSVMIRRGVFKVYRQR